MGAVQNGLESSRRLQATWDECGHRLMVDWRQACPKLQAWHTLRTSEQPVWWQESPKLASFVLPQLAFPRKTRAAVEVWGLRRGFSPNSLDALKGGRGHRENHLG